MSGFSTKLKTGECREVLFWLLLLGSWQFLASPGNKNGIVGATGTVAFLVFAWNSLDRLTNLGLDYVRWRAATGANWLYAVAGGVLAGAAVFAIGSVSRQGIGLSNDWHLVVLQITLGPVLEEVVFRGYLLTLLTLSFRRLRCDGSRNRLVVAAVAVAFALVHLSQPGVGWLQLVCIASTGTLYGWLRCRSGSVAPAAVSHAAYNLTLYGVAVVVAAISKVSSAS
ncbi:MAG: CPBP family intramembrane glutamic endopeptidase [Bryobacteraceae bacterium]